MCITLLPGKDKGEVQIDSELGAALLLSLNWPITPSHLYNRSVRPGNA